MFALQALTETLGKGLKDASGSLMSRAEECLLRWVRVLLRVPCMFLTRGGESPLLGNCCFFFPRAEGCLFHYVIVVFFFPASFIDF